MVTVLLFAAVAVGATVLQVGQGGTNNTAVTNGGVAYGDTSVLGGKVSFTSSGTSTQVLLGGTPPAFGQAPNAALANSSVAVSAGTGLTGGGTVALGGSTTLALSTPVSVANGGTGAATSSAHTVFGNTASVATAPSFTDAPVVDSLQVPQGTAGPGGSPLQVGTTALAGGIDLYNGAGNSSVTFISPSGSATTNVSFITPPGNGSSGQVLEDVGGGSTAWQSPAGDVSGTLTALSVDKIKGQSLTGNTPSGGNALVYSSGAGAWTPSAINLAGGSTSITGTLPVGNGGTGQTGFGSAAGALLVSGASGTGALGSVTAVASGSVLTSAGTGTNPAWAATSVAINGTAPQLVLGQASAGDVGELQLRGSTSGTANLTVAAAAGTPTVTLPTVSWTGQTALPAASGALVTLTSTGAEGTLASASTGTVLMGNGSGNAPLYSSSPSVTGSLTAGTNVTAQASSGTAYIGAKSTATNAAGSAYLISNGTGQAYVGFNGTLLNFGTSTDLGQAITMKVAVDSSGGLIVTGTESSGFATLSSGTTTVTVRSSGASKATVCVCTDTTAVAAVRCNVPVNSTTLTITGTGSDVIAYHCFAQA